MNTKDKDAKRIEHCIELPEIEKIAKKHASVTEEHTKHFKECKKCRMIFLKF